MVRHYVPKKSARWRDKDKRMARVVELRGMGWSLRRIADRLAVGKSTVERDLTRWDRERPNVTPIGVPSARPKVPPAGRDGTAEWDTPDTNIIPIRRSS